MGHAVPLVYQLFAAPIGGSGHSGLALAPLDNLDGTMENCRIMLTIRPIREDGKWGAKCRKVYDLNGLRWIIWMGQWKIAVKTHLLSVLDIGPAGK